MRKAILAIIAAAVVFITCGRPATAAEEKVRRLPLAEYLDKMKAAWIGQMGPADRVQCQRCDHPGR